MPARLQTRDLLRIAEWRWGFPATWTCVYCGRHANSVDHFTPLNNGGTDDRANLVPSCSRCNSHKKDRDPIEWMTAVGVPEPSISNLQRITADADWRKARGSRLRIPRTNLDYDAGTRVPRPVRIRAAKPTPPAPGPNWSGLAEIFEIDEDAWTPRQALYRRAAEYTGDPASTLPPVTSQKLYALLRARGFKESKRKGVYGFKGLRVADEHWGLPRLVPEHSASSYRAGDRHPAAKRARRHENIPGSVEHELYVGPGELDRFTPADEAAAIEQNVIEQVRFVGSPQYLAQEDRLLQRLYRRRQLESDMAALILQADDIEDYLITAYGDPLPPETDADMQEAANLRAQADAIAEQLAQM